MNTNSRELLTLEQASVPLGVSPRKLRKLIAAGDIKSVRIGRQLRVPAVALDDYIDRLLAAAG